MSQEPPGHTPGPAALPLRQKVVLVMDLVESVRLMAQDELQVIDHWRSFVLHARGDVLPRCRGRMVKSLGDGIMAEFESARDGVSAALSLHRHFDAANASLPPDRRLYLRAGLNATHVYVDDIDIYGSGVNLAARVASLAGPGETMVTADVRDGLADGLDADIQDMGDCYMKHVPGPVRVLRVGAAGPQPLLVPEREYAPLQPTIAVIPFESRANEPERLAVGDLISEGVIAQLSRTPGLRVIARLSATALRGRSMSLQEMGAHSGATYVVSGSYLVHNGKLRTSVELGAVRDGTVLWSTQVASDMDDLVAPDSQLCLEIAVAVAREVVQAEAQKVSYRPLPNLECSTLLIGAIALMHRRNPEAIERAQRTLDYLNQRMPKQPLGHAWLAKSFVLIAGQGDQPGQDDLAQHARASADRALALDPGNSLALTINGIVCTNLRGEYEGARRYYEQALAADPNNSLAWLYYASLAIFEGQGARAWEMAQRALQLSPLDPQKYIYQGIAASACLANDDLSRAIDLATDSIRLNHAHMSAWRIKTIALALAGRDAEAQAAAAQLMRLTPQFSVERFLRRNSSADARLRQLYSEALASAGIPRSTP